MPVLGKTLVKLLKLGVIFGLERNKFLHDVQYCFRECRSTVHVIMAALDPVKYVNSKGHYPILVSVDIKGAFENIQWSFIREALREAPLDLGILL